MSDQGKERTIDSVPSCGQENDWRKAEVPSSLLRHFCGCETCQARGQEIQCLRTEIDTLRIARDDLLKLSRLETDANKRLRTRRADLRTGLNDILSHLRAGIDKLKFRLREHNLVEIPIELHKACHALTHIVAQAEGAASE